MGDAPVADKKEETKEEEKKEEEPAKESQTLIFDYAVFLFFLFHALLGSKFAIHTPPISRCYSAKAQKMIFLYFHILSLSLLSSSFFLLLHSILIENKIF